MLEYIRTLDPKIVYAVVSALAGLIIYVWRKVSIETWDLVTRKNEILQTLPAMILAGLMSAAPVIGKPMWTVVANIVFGAIFGGGAAIVGHQVLKASPLAYNGGVKPVPMFPPAAGVSLQGYAPGGDPRYAPKVTDTSEMVTPTNPGRKESSR